MESYTRSANISFYFIQNSGVVYNLFKLYTKPEFELISVNLNKNLINPNLTLLF